MARHRLLRSAAPVPKFAIDVHCRSIGFPLPRAWAEPEEGCVLSPLAAMATRELSHALDAFVARLPACAAWASAVTKVVVPLQHERLERSSGSEPDIPGLIHVAGLHGPVSGSRRISPRIRPSSLHDGGSGWRICRPHAQGVVCLAAQERAAPACSRTAGCARTMAPGALLYEDTIASGLVEFDGAIGSANSSSNLSRAL